MFKQLNKKRLPSKQSQNLIDEPSVKRSRTISAPLKVEQSPTKQLTGHVLNKYRKIPAIFTENLSSIPQSTSK